MYSRRFIYNSNGDFEESTDLVTETLNEIVTACRHGFVRELETLLNLLESEKLSRYLNTMINYNVLKVHLTPLMIASVYGHDSIVRFLLQHYSHHCIVDAQNYSSNYDFDYHFYHEHFNKQTALWLAVQYEYLNVVQTLISFGKANVNHRADYSDCETNLTPLGLACRNGHLEMVKYLIQNGADLCNVDKDNSTSLMIASVCGHYDIVQYLLSLDDSSNHLLNAIDNKGSTALHKVVNGRRVNTFKAGISRSLKLHEVADRTFDIVKLLLEQHHAKIVKDNDGHTPLTIAGIRNQEELVKYFIKNGKDSWYTISQLIDELELIGSYLFIWRRQADDFEKPYQYLLWAFQLRYRDPKVPILKTNLLSPIEAYEHCTECQTVKELELIRNNPYRMVIECLMIRERAGVTANFLSSLDHQADLHRHNEYQRALQLHLHAYHLRIKTQIDLDKCISNLRECTRTMQQMIVHNRTKEIQFDLFLEILEATENEFIRNRNLTASSLNVKQKNTKFIWSLNKVHAIEKYDADKCLYIILNLLFIGIKVSEKKFLVIFYADDFWLEKISPVERNQRYTFKPKALLCFRQNCFEYNREFSFIFLYSMISFRS